MLTKCNRDLKCSQRF